MDWKIKNVYYEGIMYVTDGANKYCGYEIELYLSLDPVQARKLINNAVEICNKEQTQLSELTKMKLFNRQVTFRKMLSLTEEYEYVWRMVLTDDKGKLPEDPDCNPSFKNQVKQRNNSKS